MIKIAVAANTRFADALVPQKLATAKHLFIVDMEQFEVLKIYDAAPIARDVEFAKEVVAEDCEALVSGPLKQAAFNVLMQACISRYDGAGHSVVEAIKLLNNGQLALIRDYVDGPGCAGETSGKECHEHTHGE